MKKIMLATLSIAALAGIAMGIHANGGGNFSAAFGGSMAGSMVGTSIANSGSRNRGGSDCYCDCSKQTRSLEKQIDSLQSQNDKLQARLDKCLDKSR